MAVEVKAIITDEGRESFLQAMRWASLKRALILDTASGK